MWDHWLLDTLASWQKQAEASYFIEMDDERAHIMPRRADALHIRFLFLLYIKVKFMIYMM